MHCNKIKVCIERYTDGSLSASKLAVVDKHLKTCPDCLSAYNKTVQMPVLIKEDFLPDVPGDFTESVMAEVSCFDAARERQLGYFQVFRSWWTTAGPGVRIAYSLVFLVLMTVGIYMGGDLWKNKTATTDAVSYDNDYPGIDAFMAMQPGSIEKTYFELTTYGAERGKR